LQAEKGSDRDQPATASASSDDPASSASTLRARRPSDGARCTQTSHCVDALVKRCADSTPSANCGAIRRTGANPRPEYRAALRSLRPIVDPVRPRQDAPQAFRAMEAGKVLGKVRPTF